MNFRPPIIAGRVIRPLTLTAALALNTTNLFAGADGEHAHDAIHELDPLVVNATLAPRSSRDMLNPATVVTGDQLEQDLSPTIGAVLDGQPGVHSTAFGAGASRPVIRGLEGFRLKVMESGIDSGDLSPGSPDHAVAIEPFFSERIEVLRGASTLLYGSSAIGGVVNTIDKRIPREQPGDETTLDLMTEYNSASEGWTYGAITQIPVNEFVVSLSYLDRDHNDYDIPGHAELEEDHDEHGEDHDHDHDHDHDEDHDEEEVAGTLENSFLESRIGSVGVSWFPTDKTRLSLAWMSTDSQYGVPGHAHHEEHDEHEEGEEGDHDEEGVYIDMAHSTVDMEFEHELSGSWIQTLEGRIRFVDYDHQEMEGDELGTDFDRESWEARLTATFLTGDAAPGAIGAQLSSLDSKAVGEESLTPESETKDTAIFYLQEWHQENLRIEGGLRAERREIDVPDADYSDWAYSYSLGAKIGKAEGWSIGLLYNHAERHPSAQELYAFGPHAATRQFEIGSADLGIESANSIDLSLHYKNDVVSASLTAFYMDFSNFIYASPTGNEMDELPVYQFDQIDTVFKGFESEILWHAFHGENLFVDLGLMADWVDTDIKHSDDHLPRIPPMRIGASATVGSESWVFRTSLRHSFKQDDTALFEEPTASYTNLAASLLIDLPIQKGLWHLVLSVNNLLDEEIRSHTSPLKDVAPAPGRSLRVNLSVAF